MARDRSYFSFQSRGIEPRLWKTLPYFGAGLLPSVAQPPLPLHEFLPLQPLSPALQPPLPLQEFWPWQACLSDLALPICSETPGFPVETAAWVVAANEPLINPAIAAPATIAFFVIGTFLFCFLLALTAAPGRRKSIKSAPNPIADSGLCDCIIQTRSRKKSGNFYSRPCLCRSSRPHRSACRSPSFLPVAKRAELAAPAYPTSGFAHP